MKIPDKTSEVRIGLVLYGGVSLCVYINGVAQEFFRAVLGYKPYQLLKALLGSDIAVDVISGTSAGGVNGIYLAYSLCQQDPKNFLEFSRLWRDDGDIGKLLHEPGRKETNSLLDGKEYYQKQLEAAFSQIEPDGNLPNIDRTVLNELDLFITGTDYEGNIYTRFDDTGRLITVKDHRTVFQLKYRKGRYNDFDSSIHERCHNQLAKLARITSCFPVAFPPVEVTTTCDPLIAKWGRLAPKPHSDSDEEPPRYYLDGGILDNKPFSYTVNSIYHRATTDARRVSRKLFYVEPVPEVFGPQGKIDTPNVLETGIAALISIPGYESIGEDLGNILERNRQILRFAKLEKEISERRMQRVKSPVPEECKQAVEDALKEAQNVYYHSRLGVLLDRVLQGILRDDQGREFTLSRKDGEVKPEEAEPGEVKPEEAESGEVKPEEAESGEPKSDEVKETEESKASDLYGKLFNIFLIEYGSQQEQILQRYDSDYWMRRFFHVIYSLINLESSNTDSLSRQSPANGSIPDCYRWIKCLEIIGFATQRMVDRTDFKWRERNSDEVWPEVEKALNYLLAASPEVTNLLDATPNRKSLTELLKVLNDRISSYNGVASTETKSLLQWLKWKFDDESFLGNDATARDAWLSFDDIDIYRYPMQAASGIFEQDKISTVRVSPLDAQLGFSRQEADKKLSGDQLANFGGFFKKSWRSNDILWGRLDGMSKIFEALLTKEAMEKAPKSNEWTVYRHAVINSFEWGQKNATLKNWLLRLSENDPKAIKKLSSKAKGSSLDKLVGFLQEDIAKEGLAMVAEDSITEQIDWNCAKIQDSKGLSFHIDQHKFTKPSSGFISIAAQQLAKDAIDDDKISDLRKFFDCSYKVGTEKLANDVPKPILVELASRAALVLRDCLVPKMEQAGVKITAAKLYKYGFNYPLHLTNGFARLVRYAPTSARVVTFVLFFLSLAALAAGIFMWDAFIHNEDGFHLRAFLLLIALPFVYFSVLPELLDWQQLRGHWLRKGVTWLLVAGSIAGMVYLGWWFSSLQNPLGKWLGENTSPVASVLLTIAIAICAIIIAFVVRMLLRKLKKPSNANRRRTPKDCA